MASLPVMKLGGLLIKTLAKPLSKRVKYELSRFDMGKVILIGIGEGIHQITSRLTIWSSGYKVRSIKALETEKALKNGSEVVGEGFLLLVSGGIVVYEYGKSKEKDKLKSQKAAMEKKQFHDTIYTKLDELNNRITQLENNIITLQQQQEKQQRKEDIIIQKKKKQGEEKEKIFNLWKKWGW